MKYYKDVNEKPWAYEDNAKDEQIKNGLTSITEAEYNIIAYPSLTEAQAIIHFKSMYLEILNTKLKELDYDSIATVQLWMSDATYGTEATRTIDWYKALINKNYAILSDAKASGVVPTDEEYLAEIAKVVF